eukprot:3933590-Rhodomonas_salina.1
MSAIAPATLKPPQPKTPHLDARAGQSAGLVSERMLAAKMGAANAKRWVPPLVVQTGTGADRDDDDDDDDEEEEEEGGSSGDGVVVVVVVVVVDGDDVGRRRRMEVRRKSARRA